MCLLGIFAAATLSIDAGNAWQTRRNVVTATDAAALAEAGDLAYNGSSTCTGLFNTVLSKNAGSDVYDRKCTVTRIGDVGYVMVEGRKGVDVRFGSVVGVGDTNAYSMSAAVWGFPTAVQGLRPMAFCKFNSHVQTWENLKKGLITPEAYAALKGSGDTNGDGLIDFPADLAYAPYGVIHRMYFDKDIDDNLCGSFPGNWGWLSFDGLPADSTDRNSWIKNGYSGSVAIRLDSQSPCPGVPGSGGSQEAEQGCVPADSGDLAGHNASSLDSILHKPVHITIFDAGACSGGGTTCTFEAWAFVGVILRGYKSTGAQHMRFFDFEFIDLQASGTCCSAIPPNADLGVRAVKICAVDHDSQVVATRCALN